MAASRTERLEMRVPPRLKALVRRAARARRQSLTDFALDALTRAATQAIESSNPLRRRSLGWAAGTARELGDIVAPASGDDEWEALRE